MALYIQGLSPWAVFTTTFLAYSAYVAIYRIFFHPLRNIPGPKLAAATRYYQGYYDLWRDGDLVRQLAVLHKRYGPVVRTGPNDVHFSDPKAYASIYTVGSKFLKDPKFYESFGEDECSFGYTNPKEAKVRRDILNPSFSRRSILKLERVIQDKINAFLNQVVTPQYRGKPVNMYLAFRSTTLDIISSYCFACTYDAIYAPNFEHPILVSMEAKIPMWSLFKYFRFMNVMLKFPDWLTLRLSPESQGFINLRQQIEAQINQLIANPSNLESAEHQTIYHALLNPHPDKGQHGIPTKKSLIEEAINLLFAGSDTVGNASTIGTFYVLNDEAVYNKLITELQQAWPDIDAKMPYEALEKLPYLTAVIKESLRLSHGVTIPLPRIIPHGTTAHVLGLDIPGGMVISMGASFVHLNEEIFPDPHKFDPERWLQPNARTLDNYLVSFSRGPRSCIGINLAWCEMYLIFANVFRKLDLQIYNTSVEDMEVRDHFLPIYRGRPFQVLVKERLS